LTYTQLFENLPKSSTLTGEAASNNRGVPEAAEALPKILEQTHMVTWPELLMDLSPGEELYTAFEEAQREEFCPTAGVLWKFAQRDRDAIREAAFTEHWRRFLKALKKHGWEWQPAMFRIADWTAEHPLGQGETRPAPVFDVEFEAALSRAFGCDIQQARKYVFDENPMFGIVQTNSPALQARSSSRSASTTYG
jgi:hypothetical protein